MAATVTSLLSMLTADPGRPRLTWYGPDGERIELSGAVLANWITKTTNLLVEEFDAAPATVVHLDLPPHWRTLVWALATWQTGACVRLAGGTADGAGPEGPGSASGADVVVTSGPDGARTAGLLAGRPELVVVSLPALARRYDGTLPPGAVDAASAVMTYGDQLGYLAPAEPGAPAVELHGTLVAHSDLAAWAAGASAGPGGTVDTGPRPRVLLCPAATSAGTVQVLRRALACWAQDGSVVVAHPEVAAAYAADPERLARVVASERVTATEAGSPSTAGEVPDTF